ncbi:MULTISPECIES: hypothetical protein [Candidatus Nitrosocaldus]|jgi:hypothetical protein|uniref:Uncharacterized protein n=1 Tax=Candidatus Nitrosocaldus cavascurensis TaxID=2058097 RepID=A0A2K5ATD8_9ARCH|nr:MULTISPECIES: hypothetical protein [Candidatus Nitrosocaldus]SPC34903.1 conserved protein of unknown function [Candidatus Nitrosocaldus cavascurensis]
MVMLKERALMIFEEDVMNADVLKRLRAMIVTQMLPPHRYDGTLTIDEGRILFDGKDLISNERFRLSIPMDSIRDIHLGFDDLYIGKDSKGKRYQLSPIRLKYVDDTSRQRMIYIFPEFRGLFRTNSSEEVYRILMNAKVKEG